ncbi:chitinase C-terminal domain-containing protein [Streptomyces sp. AC563]|uniref:chitinase C-terminal domain-containing protein n=1 Tax=Streptomyces buecherae TaxID=2763006 RepID=UPI00164DAA4B|nr:glycosyl hydrolase family 18 protein [Streptomyces buecherae]MBC3989309.1 chitinase C-terminal domain-containing protein [Streptomyces buecherae]
MLSRTRARATLAASAAALAGLLVSTLSVAESHAEDQSTCRPDGMYRTPGVDVPYCSVYDADGREKMGADHQRRVIGYFTSWRTGKDGTPAYLANNIPWDKVTHLNYAFAHVDKANKLSVGADSANNPATGMTWPGVEGAEMDPAFPYKGHFNQLSKFKKKHPNVKTLISVGGWAETGGYIDENGQRVKSGGFYSMATNADGSVNQAGINTFADSAVDFIRQYGFNGVDIDYEYPTSMKDAGHPQDWPLANARRGGLNKGYAALMKTLREKLDRASAADGKHYLLSVAAPSSAYLLRGMETYQTTKYLDYVNIMSYDLHGAWNEFVGPNAALYDDGKDAELAKWGVYTASQYGGIGYLNGDWSYHYFRGSMPAGRINLGLPYYTRGWKNVNGGKNGLWGTSKASSCPAGSGLTECGDGAVGIDNLWHDKDDNGKESPAGSNPMWHAKNLEKGVVGDYVIRYGFPADTKLTGAYTRNYDSTLVAPWLWNADKKVFLSTEDEQSVKAKAQYVVDKGLGGTMIWELAGDYQYNAGKGQYEPGNTLTNTLYDAFKAAPGYGAKRATTNLPAEALDLDVNFGEFPLGDSNYPISPKVRITNNTKTTIPGGAEFQFDYATASPNNAKDQSGWGLKVIRSDHTGNNVGGLKGDYHRTSFKLPSWQSLAPGASLSFDLVYYLPTSTPSNWTVSFGGKSYSLAGDLARGTKIVDPGDGTSGGTGGTGGNNGGNGGQCTAPAWDKTAVYNGGAAVSWKGHNWTAKWWTQGQEPGVDGVWQDKGAC